MKSRLLTTLLFLLMTVTGFAADITIPEQKIVGAEKPIALGELVDLSISAIQFPPKNLVMSATEWKVFEFTAAGTKEKKVRVNDGGAFFASGIENKKLLAVCTVTHLYVTKEGDKVTDIATRTAIYSVDVTIGNGNPIPNPTPTPPTPNVVIPDGNFKVARAVYDLAMKDVPEANRLKGAKVLATSFKGISAAIAGGVYKDDKDATRILLQTKEANQNALKNAGIPLEDWKPFFAEFMDVIFTLHKDGTVASPSDFKLLWDEIVVGFEAVK